jgi:hypothetical protein
MTEDYRLWAERWKRVNAIEIEELRRTPPDVCLRQFFSLLNMARAMNWHTSTPREIDDVRARWNKLRKAYGG